MIQAIAAAAGVDPQLVVSPTFVLIHEYAGRVPIYHCDAYRLRDADEFLRLGADEYFGAGGWTLIEWADRVPSALPADRLEIRIEPTGPTVRRFSSQRQPKARAALGKPGKTTERETMTARFPVNFTE